LQHLIYSIYRPTPLALHVGQLHQFTALVFVHHSDTLPDISHNCFTLNSSVLNYATRQKDGLHVFHVNTTYGQRSVRHK